MISTLVIGCISIVAARSGQVDKEGWNVSFPIAYKFFITFSS